MMQTGTNRIEMFEESVHHAHEKRDYDYPTLGYRDTAKVYYELSALSGYSRGAYYLGKSYITDKDYKQAEKWLLIAAEQNVTDACYELGRVYCELWKQDRQPEYLEKARTWKKTALQINDSVSEWYDMVEFCKDILINGKIEESGQKQELLSEMTEYYTKVAYSRADYLRKSVCEELVRIYMGDYGTVEDIDKAFLYGDAAFPWRSIRLLKNI
ncbi:MAG: hypothetical protein K2M91_12725 [Lachnospiraceae bacterium]|nr:hypothetical protein [Lachnospiraceae bacterium]